MKEEFKELYNLIINSEDKDKMHVLGEVTKNMMCKFIDSYPQQAREYLDMLQSVKWHNYVTANEADKIVADMNPAPKWTYTNWEKLITSNIGMLDSEEPFYNKYALYVTMCMISSDSYGTIVSMFKSNNIELTENKLFDFIYSLALDKLKDVDKKFNIRSYFNL